MLHFLILTLICCRWVVYNSQGTFPCVAGAQAYRDGILAQGGPEALRQWMQLEEIMKPLQNGAALFPAAAIRSDPGVLLTAARFMGPQLALTGLVAPQLTGPFANVVDKVRGDGAPGGPPDGRHCLL